MLLLRRYTYLLPDLAGALAAAGTLWEALIEAHLNPEANRWRLQLDGTGLAGLATRCAWRPWPGRSRPATACTAPTTSPPTPSPTPFSPRPQRAW